MSLCDCDRACMLTGAERHRGKIICRYRNGHVVPKVARPMPEPSTDSERAAVLSSTAGANYDCDHPGFSYCGGCVVKIDGDDMLADLREAGWELVRRPADA